VEKAIRSVDPDHILWLDGNTYSMDSSGFKEILPNCVHAIHDYSNMGFLAGNRYTGTDEQKQILRKQYQRKVEFMREHKVPVSRSSTVLNTAFLTGSDLERRIRPRLRLTRPR